MEKGRGLYSGTDTFPERYVVFGFKRFPRASFEFFAGYLTFSDNYSKLFCVIQPCKKAELYSISWPREDQWETRNILTEDGTREENPEKEIPGQLTGRTHEEGNIFLRSMENAEKENRRSNRS
jgi:hypothetical protein